MASVIQQVLGVSPQSLDEDVILDLVQNAVPEGQHLDYKSTLPGGGKTERTEFARDVAAMANAGGGVIIFGVVDKNEVAAATTPVQLGQEITRLQQIASAFMAPLPLLSTYEIATGSPDTGYIVLEVADSANRPFALLEGSTLGFYMRVGRTRHPMSEADVERMYRDRFQRHADIRARLDELTTAIHQHWIVTRRPVVYIAATPSIRYDRLFRPTRAETRSLVQLPSLMRQIVRDGDAHITPLATKLDPVFGLGDIAPVIPNIARPSFKSLELTQVGFDEEFIADRGWVAYHDDGAYLSASPSRLSITDTKGESTTLAFWSEQRLIAEVLSRLGCFWALCVNYHVTGDVNLRIGTAGLNPNRKADLIRERDFVGLAPHDTCQLDRDVETSINAAVDDLAIGPPLLRTAKILLDDLFTAFCWPECLPISVDGQFRAQYIAADYRIPYIKPWTDKVGISWTDETVT